jgi:D-serine dehydratase
MSGGRRMMEAPIDAWEKGAPALKQPLALSSVPEQDWRILREDFPLPIALIKQRALLHNSEWMKSFLGQGGVLIAPHGKTTMAPELFDLQLADGAWAITLSTFHQIRVARAFGYDRIFLANQVVGRVAIESIVAELKEHSEFDFYCLADSIAGAGAIASAAQRAGLDRPVNLLVELGYEGGRTGCRTIDGALDLARWIKATPEVALRGIEGFEGLLRGSTPMETLGLVQDFLDRVIRLAERCSSENLFSDNEVILSAGGSSFFDVVAEKLKAARHNHSSGVLLRAGCYITHDSVMYVRAFEALVARNPDLAALSGLQAELGVWAYVQSRPEPGQNHHRNGQAGCFLRRPTGRPLLVPTRRHDSPPADAQRTPGRSSQRPALSFDDPGGFAPCGRRYGRLWHLPSLPHLRQVAAHPSG